MFAAIKDKDRDGEGASNMEKTMKRPRIAHCGVAILFLVALTLPLALTQAQDLAAFEKRMTKFTLDNGLKFLVLERHEAPVVSFHTYADVGAVDEVKGITGHSSLFVIIKGDSGCLVAAEPGIDRIRDIRHQGIRGVHAEHIGDSL